MRRFKIVFAIISLAVLTAGCQSENSATETEKKFWELFAKNSERLYSFDKNQVIIFNELDKELFKVNKGLTFEFGPIEHGRREFTISAGGVKRVFPAVKSLVAAAPNLPKFKIQAFRQPKDLGFKFKVGTHELGAEDFWFKHKKSGEIHNLEVYIKGLTKVNKQQYISIAFLLMDAAIGEYNVVMRIGALDFKALPENPKDQDLRPITDLSKVVMGK